jgi:hypothetical protein
MTQIKYSYRHLDRCRLSTFPSLNGLQIRGWLKCTLIPFSDTTHAYKVIFRLPTSLECWRSCRTLRRLETAANWGKIRTLGLKFRTETNQAPVDDAVTDNENVLPGQESNRGIGRRGVIVGNVISRGKKKNWRKHLLHYHFVHHKAHKRDVRHWTLPCPPIQN